MEAGIGDCWRLRWGRGVEVFLGRGRKMRGEDIPELLAVVLVGYGSRSARCGGVGRLDDDIGVGHDHVQNVLDAPPAG